MALILPTTAVVSTALTKLSSAALGRVPAMAGEVDPNFWRDVAVQSPNALAVLLAAIISYVLGVKQERRAHRQRTEQDAVLELVRASRHLQRVVSQTAKPTLFRDPKRPRERAYCDALREFLDIHEVVEPNLRGAPIVDDQTWKVAIHGRMVLSRMRRGMKADTWSEDDMDLDWLTGPTGVELSRMLDDFADLLKDYSSSLSRWRATGIWDHILPTPGSLDTPVRSGTRTMSPRRDEALFWPWRRQQWRLKLRRVCSSALWSPLIAFRSVRARITGGGPALDTDSEPD